MKSVEYPSFTVTPGYLQAGAEHVGDFDESHILMSDDCAMLQGFTEPLQWPKHVTETRRKTYVAQCVVVPFAEMISEAAFSYQNACLESELVTVKLAQLGNMSEIDSFFVLACALADERVNGDGQFEADLLETVGEKVVEDGPAYDVDDLGNHRTTIEPYLDFPLPTAASSSIFALRGLHTTMIAAFGKKTKGCLSSKARFSAVVDAFCSSKEIPTAHRVHGVCPARLAAFFSEERGCAAYERIFVPWLFRPCFMRPESKIRTPHPIFDL